MLKKLKNITIIGYGLLFCNRKIYIKYLTPLQELIKSAEVALLIQVEDLELLEGINKGTIFDTSVIDKL